MNLTRMVEMLTRCCIFLVKRDALRNKAHRRVPSPENPCDCIHCQWVNGLEAEGDERLEAGWR